MQASEEHAAANDGAEVLSTETPADSKIANYRTKIMDGGIGGPDRKTAQPASPQPKDELLKIGSSVAGLDTDEKQKTLPLEPDVNGASMSARESLAVSGQSGEANACGVIPPSVKFVS